MFPVTLNTLSRIMHVRILRSPVTMSAAVMNWRRKLQTETRTAGTYSDSSTADHNQALDDRFHPSDQTTEYGDIAPSRRGAIQCLGPTTGTRGPSLAVAAPPSRALGPPPGRARYGMNDDRHMAHSSCSVAEFHFRARDTEYSFCPATPAPCSARERARPSLSTNSPIWSSVMTFLP